MIFEDSELLFVTRWLRNEVFYEADDFTSGQPTLRVYLVLSSVDGKFEYSLEWLFVEVEAAVAKNAMYLLDNWYRRWEMMQKFVTKYERD